MATPANDRKWCAEVKSGLKIGPEGAEVDGSDVPGLVIHCMGWRLEDVELSQDTVVISLFFPPGLEDRRDKRCAVYVEVRTELAETVQMTQRKGASESATTKAIPPPREGRGKLRAL